MAVLDAAVKVHGLVGLHVAHISTIPHVVSEKQRPLLQEHFR